jgi:hypothetical protein
MVLSVPRLTLRMCRRLLRTQSDPAEVNKFGSSQTVPVSHQDYRGVPLPHLFFLAASMSRSTSVGKVLAGAQRGIWQARKRNSSIFNAWSYALQVIFRHVFSPSRVRDCSNNVRSSNSSRRKNDFGAESF